MPGYRLFDAPASPKEAGEDLALLGDRNADAVVGDVDRDLVGAARERSAATRPPGGVNFTAFGEEVEQ